MEVDNIRNVNIRGEASINLDIGAEASINLTIGAESPIQFADAARGVPATLPSMGQTPPVGNGAHSVPPPYSAECAPGFTGTAILDLDQIVNRVLAANRVIERMAPPPPTPPCPQKEECAGDGQHTRIFECEEGCGFLGCASCMEVHEAEPHASDSVTAREMYDQIG